MGKCQNQDCSCHHSQKPESEWSEFDEEFPRLSVSTMNADKLGWNLVHRTAEVKAYIKANYVSKQVLEREFDYQLESGVPPSCEYVLNLLKQRLLALSKEDVKLD